jgi:pyruvate oxidase
VTSQRQESDFVPIGKVRDFLPGEGKMARPAAGRLRGKPIAVFNENGTFHVLNYVCPHMGGPMSEGTIENGIVTCPWHGWTFLANSGMPDHVGGHSTTAYECKIEGDELLVGWIKPT